MQKHTCYHLFSDHNNEFVINLNDVKQRVNSWKNDGEDNIKVYRIMTEEIGSDAINLEEREMSLEELDIQ